MFYYKQFPTSGSLNSTSRYVVRSLENHAKRDVLNGSREKHGIQSLLVFTANLLLIQFRSREGSKEKRTTACSLKYERLKTLQLLLFLFARKSYQLSSALGVECYILMAIQKGW